MKSKSVGGLCLVALLILAIAIIVVLLFPSKVSQQEIDVNTAYAVTVEAEKEIPTSTPEKSPVAKKADTSNVPQVLLDISWCESRDDQAKRGYNYRYRNVTHEDGTVTKERYLWSTDIGRWQINDYYHLERAKKLGLDLYTEKDNLAYAILLYNENGTQDWNPSRECWRDIDAWKAKQKSFY